MDLNCGCPIDDMTRRGIGARCSSGPSGSGGLLAAMATRCRSPVTVKIRLGWSDDTLNHLEVAKAAVEAGRAGDLRPRPDAQPAVSPERVLGRIGEVAAARPDPGHRERRHPVSAPAREFRARARCAGVMIARAALIKPWIFREIARDADEDPTPAERIALYARWVALAREHSGDDERGDAPDPRVRRLAPRFLVPPRAAPHGRKLPAMQEREERFEPRSEEEALLSRNDAAAHDGGRERLVAPERRRPQPPPPRSRAAIPEGGRPDGAEARPCSEGGAVSRGPRRTFLNSPAPAARRASARSCGPEARLVRMCRARDPVAEVDQDSRAAARATIDQSTNAVPSERFASAGSQAE